MCIRDRSYLFPRPRLGYTISGGGSSDGGGDTVIDENDTPLGPLPELNIADHFAYIIGRDDGLVHPEASITRAEVATIFFRMLTEDSRAQLWTTTNPYSDVAAEAWYNNAVSTPVSYTHLSVWTGGVPVPSSASALMGSIPNSITRHNSMATSRDEPFRIPVLITNILPCEPAPSADNRGHGEEMPERGAERPWRGGDTVSYTHLDVYKRQGEEKVAEGDKFLRADVQVLVRGGDVYKRQGLEAIEQEGAGLACTLSGGGKVFADMVLLAIDVRADHALAQQAGLELDIKGSIRVDEHMATSDPDIYAVGDAVAVSDFVSGEKAVLPLAGPANRQGRMVADLINGREASYEGTQGTCLLYTSRCV